MTQTRRPTIVGTTAPYAALTLAAALFGATFVVIKGAVETLPPLSFVGWRFLIAALALAVLGLPRGRTIWRDAASAGTLLFLGYALQTVGLVTTTASKSGLITGLYVIFTPLLAGASARRRPRVLAIVGGMAAVAGLTLLTSPGGGQIVPGDILTVGAALAFAGHIVVLARTVHRHPVVRFTAAQMVVVAILALATSALTESLPRPAIDDVPALLMTGLLVSGGAYLAQIWAQTRVGPERTATVLTLEPVFAAATGMLVLGERLTPAGWLGAGLIMAAIYVVVAGTPDDLTAAESVRTG